MSRILIVGAGQAGLQLALGLPEMDTRSRSSRTARPTTSERPRDVEPVHVRRCAPDRARPRHRLLGVRLPAGGGHLAGGTRAGRQRQGDRLRGATRSLRAVRRPAGEDAGLDGAARAARGQARDPGRRGRGSRALHARERPRDRRGGQGRDRAPVPARRRALSVRAADARAGAHVRDGARAAARVLGGVLQPRARRRGVLRVPGADDDRSLRDHGVRGRPRRPDGLLGRCAHARRAPERSRWILEQFMPWEAERCRDIELTDPNGILVGRLPADGAPAGGRAAVRTHRARSRGRDHAERSDHRPGLEQRREDGDRVSRGRSGGTATRRSTARSRSARSRSSGPATGSSRPAGRTRCYRRRPSTC